MAVTAFGSFPTVIPIKLTTGQDFGLTLRNTPAGVVTNWPAGAALAIVFSTGTIWSATVSTSNAVWSVNKSVSDLVVGDNITYRMTYTDTAGSDLVPYKGRVIRDDTAQ